jgi:putative solute:sodium symporter small subunit
MIGTELKTMSFIGYPLAYYMTAQGSLLAFVIILFWTAINKKKSTKNMVSQKERMTNV